MMMQNKTSAAGGDKVACRLLFLAAATTLFYQPTAAPGQELSGAFAGAVEYAQQRTVKLYGASIGRVSGFATGLVVSADGKIITSQGIHLAANQIRVTLYNGKMYEAKILKRSHRLQLALLQLKGEKPDEVVKTPSYFELSEKPVARKGDWILAVSNAFKVADGSEPLSVNLGIMSLRTQLDVRRGVQDFSYDGDVLLIDAITSNPGAAGGAVVTADQRLAGMIGKVLESKSTNTRLNYAVPSDLIAKFVAGKISDADGPDAVAAGNATLGVRLFMLGGRKGPAYIDRVLPGSPASKAKLRPDDLIVSIAGESVRDVNACEAIAKTLIADKEITIVVKRKAKLIRVQITPVAEEKK